MRLGGHCRHEVRLGGMIMMPAAFGRKIGLHFHACVSFPLLVDAVVFFLVPFLVRISVCCPAT